MENQPPRKPSSEKFICSIIDYIADPVFVKDRLHRWVYLNDAFCKFMGHTKEELLGKTDSDFFPKTEADIFWEKDELVFNTRKENINEEKFTDSKGVTHIIVTKKSLLDAEAEDLYIVGIIRDITERKLMEKDLRDKMHELEIFNRAAVDRELKMIELKKKIEKLEAQLKQE